MAADASSVSLSSCEESTYIAVYVGNVKKINPTLKAVPVTANTFMNKYPHNGSTSSLNPQATNDKFKFPFTFLMVNTPPMESSAKGKVTKEAS